MKSKVARNYVDQAWSNTISFFLWEKLTKKREVRAQRALVVFRFALEVLSWYKMHDWHRVVHFLVPGVPYVLLLAVPPRADQKEPVAIHAVLGGTRNLCRVLETLYLVREGKRVYRDAVPSCMHLQNAGHKALLEEEGR